MKSVLLCPERPTGCALPSYKGGDGALEGPTGTTVTSLYKRLVCHSPGMLLKGLPVRLALVGWRVGAVNRRQEAGDLSNFLHMICKPLSSSKPKLTMGRV